ncbi:catalase family peroxidase [Gluconobacter frateurii]|uniref:Catalase-related peroxidase n=1 Tax=Gluconobacter frateurii NRIC 0228 TaxID=1307946 RepID=A0ABQ0Q8W9_9PROT|nr:catalase family peroxidase [Gluconobacter frateurii]GBR09343.1 catalase [Gluconobacter frateurii NRIC 0228]GLP91993.1 catalase-related peroxidase [Gluconobacter frateurii]
MLQKPTRPAMLALRWLGVGAGPTALALAFLWAGGCFSPARVTQNRLMGELHNAGSYGHGFRRAHAKGVCVSGWFDASGDAAHLSQAAVFHEQHVPVIGRFALAVGQPYMPDSGTTVRSMALRFMPPDAQEWRTGMNDPPVLPLRDARDVSDFFASQQIDPATGKPSPARTKAFGLTHPWLKSAAEKNAHRFISSGFADDTFHSLDSFVLVAADGTKTAVRWTMIPMQPVKPGDGKTGDHDYLFRTLIGDIHERPLQWHLVMTLADAHDVINDPSQIWALNDQTIDAGTLTLNSIESEDGGPCTGITFDPLVLPPGIQPSDDPILQVRSAAYMRSFSLRSGEKRSPSAVTPNLIQTYESKKS